MSTMHIAVFPWDMERSLGMGDFKMSFMLASKKKGAICRPTSTGAIFEGDKQILLEILDELNNTSFGKIARRTAITVKFDESINIPFLQTEDQQSEREVANLEISHRYVNGKSDRRILHDMIVRRLGRYVGDEEDFVE